MLTVYVDDFKLSGPTKHMGETWELIRRGLDMDQPGPLDLYLGCKHETGTHKMPDGKVVRTLTYNMGDFSDHALIFTRNWRRHTSS